MVRPLLVPSMMNLLGAANYWPARVPPPSRTPLVLPAPQLAEEDDEEEEVQQAAAKAPPPQDEAV